MSQHRRYYLMHKDNIVLEARINDEESGAFTEIIGVENEKHLPPDILFLDWQKERKIKLLDLNKWWSKRGMPDKRDGLVPLMGYLRVVNKGLLQMMNYGLSLSDAYWIKPVTDTSTWAQVNFFTNPFSMDIGKAMFGTSTKDKSEINTVSPDLSTNGWLKKTWRIKDGIRYLLKAGSDPNHQEPINEILATKLLETLNIIPFVHYSLASIKGAACCACRNFLDENTEYVPAALIYKTEPRPDDCTIYQHLINRCRAFGIENMEDFLDRMLQVDFILANSDRHLGNFGFLRDANTLEFLGPAPLFDNGTSLWNHDAGNKLLRGMNLSRPFANLHENQIQFVNHFHITPQMLADIPELFEEIMIMKSTLSRARIRSIREALSENIESFNHVVEMAPPEKKPIGGILPIETSYKNPFAVTGPEVNNSVLDNIISGARKTIIDSRTKPVSHKPDEEYEVKMREIRGGRY